MHKLNRALSRVVSLGYIPFPQSGLPCAIRVRGRFIEWDSRRSDVELAEALMCLRTSAHQSDVHVKKVV